MGSFTQDQADRFKGVGGINFFQLKDNQDHAVVRFMFQDLTDVERFAKTGHEIELNGKSRFVNCLRDSVDDPIENCPFCQDGYPQKGKIFVPLYVTTTTTKEAGAKTFNEVQIFERGPRYYSDLSNYCAMYNPLISYEWKLIRNGERNDGRTKYDPMYINKDEKTFEDFPEIPEILGSFLLLDKSYEEIVAFLETGFFPEVEQPATPPPAAAAPRNPAAAPPRQAPPSQVPQRRVPGAPAAGKKF